MWDLLKKNCMILPFLPLLSRRKYQNVKETINSMSVKTQTWADYLANINLPVFKQKHNIVSSHLIRYLGFLGCYPAESCNISATNYWLSLKSVSSVYKINLTSLLWTNMRGMFIELYFSSNSFIVFEYTFN